MYASPIIMLNKQAIIMKDIIEPIPSTSNTLELPNEINVSLQMTVDDAYDLINHLAAVTGFSELLLGSDEPKYLRPEYVWEDLRLIFREATLAKEIVKNIITGLE